MSHLRTLQELRARGLVEVRDGLVYIRRREAFRLLLQHSRYVFEHMVFNKRIYDLCDEETGTCISVVPAD